MIQVLTLVKKSSVPSKDEKSLSVLNVTSNTAVIRYDELLKCLFSKLNKNIITIGQTLTPTA